MPDSTVEGFTEVTSALGDDFIYLGLETAVGGTRDRHIKTSNYGKSITSTIDVKRDHGAAGDGATDDTAAIQAAIDAAEAATPATVYLPFGTYNVSSALVIDSAKVALVGAGPWQTTIQGTSATGDILQIGDGTTDVKNVVLNGFRITSSVSKSAGFALHLNKVARSYIQDVIIDGQAGTGNLWDGVWINGIDFVLWTGACEVFAQNIGIKINALRLTAGWRTGFRIDAGKIASCDIGVKVAGGFGGLVFGPRVVMIDNRLNMLIDESEIADNNEALFFHGTHFDAPDEHNIQINCALSGNSIFLFNSCWISTSGQGAAGTWHGILITELSGTKLEISGGRIFNNDADGINIVDTGLVTNQINLSGGLRIESNGGWGIQSASSTTGVKVGSDVILSANSSGEIHNNIEPQVRNTPNKYIIADDAAASIVMPSGTNMAVVVTNNRSDAGGMVLAKSSTPSIEGIALGSNTEVTTGVLAGTTGTDVKLTVSVHTDGKLYIENRLGGQQDVYVEFFGAA